MQRPLFDTPAPRRRSNQKASKRAEMLRLHDEGLSMKEIAAEVGFGEWFVAKTVGEMVIARQREAARS